MTINNSIPRYGISQYYAEPLIHGRVDLELDLDNAEAILRVIGNLHSDPNIFSVVANICLRSETKENFVMRQGECVRARLQVFGSQCSDMLGNCTPSSPRLGLHTLAQC